MLPTSGFTASHLKKPILKLRRVNLTMHTETSFKKGTNSYWEMNKQNRVWKSALYKSNGY